MVLEWALHVCPYPINIEISASLNTSYGSSCPNLILKVPLLAKSEWIPHAKRTAQLNHFGWVHGYQPSKSEKVYHPIMYSIANLFFILECYHNGLCVGSFIAHGYPQGQSWHHLSLRLTERTHLPLKTFSRS